MMEGIDPSCCPRCLRPNRFRTRRHHRTCLACTLAGVISTPRPRYSAAQLEAAQELIEDGGIILVEPGEYRTVASDGRTIYATTTTSCTCKASRYGRRCYHRAAAMMAARHPRLLHSWERCHA